MKILVAAGGTGGHLFPALAVVECLEELSNNKIEFHFFGRTDKIEGRIVPSLGYKLHTTKLTGLVKSLSLNTFMMPFRLFNDIIKLRTLINKKCVDAVLCAGAYLSIPAGIACKLCGKKLFLMESNVNPGKAINTLANFATKIYTSFDETEKYFDNSIIKKIKYFGNPVRKNIIQSCNIDLAFEKFGLDKNKRLVLIFGGSLGSKAINNAVVKWLDNFSTADYQILWQTGNNFKENIKLPINIKQVEFINDMASAYSMADLVVSRSGATTVSELCIVGKPAVLVPLPSASNMEQYFNAKYLAEHKGALIVNNANILEELYPIVNDLMQDKQRLLDMSYSLKQLNKSDAGINIAKDILENLGN